MQPHIRIAGLIATLFLVTRAEATPVSGDQSGTWPLSQSPFELVGDVRVPPGETLEIEPGVVVNALGYYKITVEQSTLLAVGTAAQPILMTAENHATGWRGIRLLGANNASTISYSVIEYAKGTGGFPEVRGGAIYCQNCSPTISYNTLRFNSSLNANRNGTGAGVTTESSSAQVVDNLIHDNTADSGGGVCCLEYGTPVVAGNIIRNNTGVNAGGGIYMGARSSPLIERNVIMGNHSSGWGGGGINSWTSFIYYGTFATIRDNVIADNTTGAAGGGIYCRYDKAVITNNTFTGNQAGQGGALYILNQGFSVPDVVSSIAWGNSASVGPEVYIEPGLGGAVSIRYSDVEGGWSGVGNMSEDPLFADPASGDHHLLPNSPCINAGDPSFVPGFGERDIDGQARVLCDRVDMGADEAGIGDHDCDGDVDVFDFEAYLACVTGPGGGLLPGCETFDFDGDEDVDFADLAGFLLVVSAAP